MSFIQKIGNPRKLILIFIESTEEGLSFSGARIVSNKSVVVSQFDSLEELLKKFGKELPYHIHINGIGILTRAVENISNYKEQLIVNGDKDDFYFTSYELKSRLITSFFRKTLIQKVVEELEHFNAFILNISCGIIPCIMQIKEQGKIYYDYTITIKDGNLESFQRIEKQNHTTIFESQFKTYSEAIADSIVRNLKEPDEQLSFGYTSEEREKQLRKFIDYNRFKISGITLVFSILFILIANYFYVNSLNQDVADLEVELALNNENLSLLGRLEQEKVRKEQLILTSGINSKSFLSYYIDEIGKTVPPSIKLSEMYIFPLKERLKQKRKVEIDQESIEIRGFTNSSTILDDWMEKMNRFDWIERVELLNYSKLGEIQAEFKLYIKINK